MCDILYNGVTVYMGDGEISWPCDKCGNTSIRTEENMTCNDKELKITSKCPHCGAENIITGLISKQHLTDILTDDFGMKKEI